MVWFVSSLQTDSYTIARHQGAVRPYGCTWGALSSCSRCRCVAAPGSDYFLYRWIKLSISLNVTLKYSDSSSSRFVLQILVREAAREELERLQLNIHKSGTQTVSHMWLVLPLDMTTWGRFFMSVENTCFKWPALQEIGVMRVTLHMCNINQLSSYFPIRPRC